ncbi:MAG: YcxB family protein [Verrucomicrobia bacterium]|nr:YcxB family protein [Verrucomicrobiota bacterium]
MDDSVFGRRFARFAWLAISALAWLSVLLPYLKFREMGGGFWVRAALALILTIGFPRFYKAYTTGCFAGIINARTTARLAGPSVLTVEEDFAQVATQTTTARALWRDIHKVVVTDTHLFLFFTPLVAAPIPRSAFTNDAEFRALHARLETLWLSARQAV